MLNESYLVEQPTQTPISHCYQRNDARLQITRKSDYKFLCGSNLIWQNMLNPHPQWNINIFNYKSIKDVILVGVGSSTTNRTVNYYTKYLYNKVLSKEYIHSVRDEATRKRLSSIGINAINTGCATLWSLTCDHCSLISSEKASNVVFTLTDYLKDPYFDKEFINILLNNYDKLYFWPQGYGDFDYFNLLNIKSDKIEILPSSLNAFKDILKKGQIDYVGTRLHGGIYAIQNYIRSIIVSIDNRAREMKENYNIPCVERGAATDLEKMIKGGWKTRININEESIKKWKEQFK